jgi:hypothetical protein
MVVLFGILFRCDLRHQEIALATLVGERVRHGNRQLVAAKTEPAG